MFNRKQRRAMKAVEAKMPPRTLEDVQKAYSQTAFLAGQAQYVILQKQKELEQLNASLEALNKEGAEIQRANPPKEEPNAAK